MYLIIKQLNRERAHFNPPKSPKGLIVSLDQLEEGTKWILGQVQRLVLFFLCLSFLPKIKIPEIITTSIRIQVWTGLQWFSWENFYGNANFPLVEIRSSLFGGSMIRLWHPRSTLKFLCRTNWMFRRPMSDPRIAFLRYHPLFQNIPPENLKQVPSYLVLAILALNQTES